MKTKCPICRNEIDVIVKGRSSGQNRYGHGIVFDLLADHTGYTVDQVKTWLKKEFGYVEYVRIGDKMLEIPRSTATFSTSEWEDFMSKTRMLGSELGVYIPEPHESK